MTQVLYPPSLPGPSPGGLTPRSRKAGSNIEGPLQLRARQRDFAGATSQYPFHYSPSEMAVWLAWYRINCRRWFSIPLPGRGGFASRVVRYHAVKQQLLAGGNYRVSATFEHRGVSAVPDDLAPAYFSISGEGYAPNTSGLAQPASGTYMVFIALHRNRFQEPVFDSGWDDGQIAETYDGSSSLGIHLMARTATGTPDDLDLDFTVPGDGGGPAQWCLMGFPNRDPSIALGTNTATEAGTGINPGQVVVAGAAAVGVVACAVLLAEHAGTTISSTPAGYTEVCHESMTVFSTFHAELAVAFRKATGSTFNPGDFGDGDGAYGSGSYCSVTLGVPLLG